MTVSECDIPSATALDVHTIEHAYFRDSYSAPLTHLHAGIVDIFFGIFGHVPLGMKLLLIARNRVATWFGLEAPTASEIMNVKASSHYAVGDKIGVWPIFSLSESEIVAGRDNRHLDFRLSVFRLAEGETVRVVVSTLCAVHNVFGKLYLFFIVPFHKRGVQRLLSNAVNAGRL